jgi:hypothetical protein
MTNNIRHEILKLAQPIDSISTHARNVRQGDVGAIVQSLEAHGQYRPIVVHQETNQILAGNHTYLAARSLGWDKIAVTYVDCDDDTALRILLADNRANDLATYDDSSLAALLVDLSNYSNLNGTLYEPSDLDDLLALLEPSNLADVNTHLDLHEDNDEFTAVIKVRVSLSTNDRWQTVWSNMTQTTDDERIVAMLDAHDASI